MLGLFISNLFHKHKIEVIRIGLQNTNEIADPKLEAGRMPKNYNEILINKNVDDSVNHKIGDKIVFEDFPMALNTKKKEFIVVGIVDNPLYSTMHPERALIKSNEEKYVDSIYYISLNTVPEIISNKLPKTDIYVTMKNKPTLMTEEYNNAASSFAGEIADAFGVKTGFSDLDQRIFILTLNENTGYSIFYNFNSQIIIISIIFPILFIVVCGLVLYLIISRLILDERSMIACIYS